MDLSDAEAKAEAEPTISVTTATGIIELTLNGESGSGHASLSEAIA